MKLRQGEEGDDRGSGFSLPPGGGKREEEKRKTAEEDKVGEGGRGGSANGRYRAKERYAEQLDGVDDLDRDLLSKDLTLPDIPAYYLGRQTPNMPNVH